MEIKKEILNSIKRGYGGVGDDPPTLQNAFTKEYYGPAAKGVRGFMIPVSFLYSLAKKLFKKQG